MAVTGSLSGAKLLAAAAIFLLAGLVTGVVGVGLPPVAMPLLSLLLDPATAIAVIGGPAAVSSVVRAARGDV